ncbi:LBF_2017 N-terminal domain-containing protein [Leptospira vanthielii]|uniref:Uncharacterized protein n=1 Tax=Leptospira vanthielii serovar Holland str. Waz Holland = ATCC 700522 TaxID=1218591 RepID=N1WCN2_9LEPT|nr:hypothetical protein [Leptospira vanthielii]EMY69601.1 hypothetical protein LEP1GSC199_1974 [Leptospira vanthielii serovar Holland str. Waz Holland = ATCC 700522]
MKTSFKIFTFILLLFGTTFPIFSESKTILLILEPERDDIIQYEFELWKGTSFDLEIPFRVVANPGKIQLYIPNGYEYFRIRAVAKRQVRGFWTELFEVNSFGKNRPKETTKFVSKKPMKTDVLIPIPTKDGSSHFYLTESKIQVKPVTKESLNSSVRYRLNRGPWKVTEIPEFSFSKDGDYRLEYQVTNELGISDSMQVWEFSVDNTPPNTELLWEPNTHINKGKIYISANTNLKLQSFDLGSGVDVIRFRSSCGTSPKSKWYLWDHKNSWNELVKSCVKDLEVEISATDRLGNEEIPKRILIKQTNQEN